MFEGVRGFSWFRLGGGLEHQDILLWQTPSPWPSPGGRGEEYSEQAYMVGWVDS